MRFARARLALLTSAAAILVWLAALVTNGPTGGWDPAVLAWFRADDATLARDARLFTEIGGWRVLVPLGLAAFAILAFKRRRRAALLLFMLFGGRLLVELQKLVIAAPRPPESGFLAPAESLGFPSAHAANSMITLVGIALLVPVGPRRRALAVVVAVTLGLLIGLSRLVLGVHWPSDVIGGWAFALFWIALCIRLASAPPDPEARD